jgi:tetratricopeptide (TPR) repeat protein
MSPLFYAQVMVYLGIAYAQLATGERASDLQYALVYYQQALQDFVLGEGGSSAEASMHLGQVYARLATKDADTNLLHAIECYQAALEVYTVEQMPLVNAHLQNRLGLLYARLQADDWELNLRKAILCFKQALHSWQIDEEGALDSLVAQENLKSVYEVLACFYASKGDIRQVDALYQEANEQYANDMQRSHFWTSIGETYFRQGRWLEATQAYQRAMELNMTEFDELELVNMMMPT